MGAMIALYVGTEIYIYRKKLHLQFVRERMRRFMRILLLVTSVLPWLCIGALALWGDYGAVPVHRWQSFTLGLVFAFFFARFALAVVLLTADFLRFWRWTWRKIAAPQKIQPRDPSRRDFIKKLALVAAGLQFGNVIHAISRGKYNFTLRRETLHFADLPPAFDGMRIVQFSDFHAGSYDDADAVQEGLQLLQEQGADLILFTGDLVNVYAQEAEYYVSMMQALHAPLGRFAVLGNHDYGHTHVWPSAETESENHGKVLEMYARMGFTLLKNESLLISRGGESIRLAGVENWGRRPFPQKGDLNAALAQSAENDFIVLLSHDPTHWDAHTLLHPRKVHLTLSGHTHGAQMGVEIPGFRFSPAQWMYPRWAGLYEEAGKYLYVNRGFGHIGFPGRMGIAPEIAVIELRRA